MYKKDLYDYDLKLITKQVQEYEMLTSAQIKQYNIIDPRTVFELSGFLPHAVAKLSKVVPVQGENSLYSPTLTLQTLDENQRNLLLIIYYSARSKLMKGTATLNARFAGLTPIFLYAMKDKYNIGYEKWDKKDENFKYLLSKQQEVLLSPPPISLKEKLPTMLDDLRKQHTDKFTGWNGKLVKYKWKAFKYTRPGDKLSPKEEVALEVKYSGSDIRNKVLLQCWIAHAENRIPEAMILDLWNWDNTPEAFDEVFDIKKSSLRQQIDDLPKVEELPW